MGSPSFIRLVRLSLSPSVSLTLISFRRFWLGSFASSANTGVERSVLLLIMAHTNVSRRDGASPATEKRAVFMVNGAVTADVDVDVDVVVVDETEHEGGVTDLSSSLGPPVFVVLGLSSSALPSLPEQIRSFLGLFVRSFVPLFLLAIFRRVMGSFSPFSLSIRFPGSHSSGT